MTIRKDRRKFLLAGLAGGVSLAALKWSSRNGNASEGNFEIMKSEEEWRSILSEEEFAVLRQEATERPFTSPLNEEKRAGIFHCAGCDLPLYDSATKFDSGTGWPSFYEALDNAVGTKQDRSFFMLRTEVHCRRCGGHLGHIFDDGPPPTGKRHCINGVSLDFKPSRES